MATVIYNLYLVNQTELGLNAYAAGHSAEREQIIDYTSGQHLLPGATSEPVLTPVWLSESNYFTITLLDGQQRFWASDFRVRCDVAADQAPGAPLVVLLAGELSGACMEAHITLAGKPQGRVLIHRRS
ncbi:MAG TPA: hypothetical protein VFS21_01030 [Roseiflexaceae bacterium]|nr:hypothetical protein [Roseiflexaceae bacterium]